MRESARADTSGRDSKTSDVRRVGDIVRRPKLDSWRSMRISAVACNRKYRAGTIAAGRRGAKAPVG